MKNTLLKNLYTTYSKGVVFVLMILALAHVAKAEMNFYDYSNGLSNERVSTICKDKLGVMWVGTEAGLNQFNGYEFLEIPYFKGHNIKDTYYDSTEHVLWVGTDNGLFVFNLTTYEVLNATERFTDRRVLEIGLYNHQIVVAFANGYVLQFAKNGSVKVLFNLNAYKWSAQKMEALDIAFDDKGYLYLKMNSEPQVLLAVNLATSDYTLVKGLEGGTIWNIHSGIGHCIVNFNNDKVVLYTQAHPEKVLFLDVPNLKYREPVRVIYELNKTFFISYRESYGSYVFDEANKKFTLTDNTIITELPRSKNIRVFYKDDNNVFWIGTTKGLISVSKSKAYPFKKVFSQSDKIASIRQIITGATPNQLFIATYNGIYDYDKQTGNSILLSNTPKDVNFPLYARALYYNKQQYVYAGTESNEDYFFRYNLTTHQFENQFFAVHNTSKRITSVFSIYADEKGIIWLATDVGLASFDPQTVVLTLHSEGKFFTGNHRLMYLTKSSFANSFWACGKGGVYLVNTQTGVQSYYDASLQKGFPEVDFLFVAEDKQKNIWMATQKYGVITLNTRTKQLNTINKLDGLASDEVYGVLWQDEYTAWITTANGLSRYNIKAEKFHNYLFENGIADDEFNQHAFYVSSDSVFYLGGINGITYFDPKLIKEETDEMNVFLSSISRWGTDNKNKEVSLRADNIILNPTDYLITLNFGLSDYSSVSGNTYYYKISNINNDWISLSTSNVLTLNGIAPGKYLIKVKGMNKHGVLSSNMLTFSVEVKDRIYKTAWFYVIVSLLFAIMGYAYFRWRINRITQKQLLRTQISSNLHDEVGSLLTQIIISTDSAQYATQNVEEKNKRLTKISSLSRSAINTMSDVLWSIDSRNDFVGNLTDRMREHAEIMLGETDMEVEFEFANAKVLKVMDSQTRQHLYLIFKEAIHNIVKHSSATRVKVKYIQEGKKFELIIANNNHQLAGDEFKMTGQGTKNMKMRAAKIKAEYHIKMENDWFMVRVNNY